MNKIKKYIIGGMIGIASLGTAEAKFVRLEDKTFCSKYDSLTKDYINLYDNFYNYVQDKIISLDEQKKLVDEFSRLDKLKSELSEYSKSLTKDESEFAQKLIEGLHGSAFYDKLPKLLKRNLEGIDFQVISRLEEEIQYEEEGDIQVETNFSNKEKRLLGLGFLLSIPTSVLVYKKRNMKLW